MGSDKENRFLFVPATHNPPCNFCKHYIGFARCFAYPNGIPGIIIDEKDDAVRTNNKELLSNPCNGTEFRYEQE